jgi:hypothetical protein
MKYPDNPCRWKIGDGYTQGYFHTGSLGSAFFAVRPLTFRSAISISPLIALAMRLLLLLRFCEVTGSRRLILPVTYLLERPFTNWTRTSAESLTSFSLVLSLDASLPAVRKQVDTILRANPLWNGGKWEVMINRSQLFVALIL